MWMMIKEMIVSEREVGDDARHWMRKGWVRMDKEEGVDEGERGDSECG